MWRLTFATAAVAFGVVSANDPADFDATIMEDACDANDVDCALSLRQLRAAASEDTTALKTEGKVSHSVEAHGVKAKAASQESEKHSAAKAEVAHAAPSKENATEALLQRAGSETGVAAKLTSLLETFTGKGSKYLYHQTSPEIAAMIMHTGFKPGSAGWCGGAIYFATDPKATFTKAIGTNSHLGVILKAHVNVGRVCKMAKTCDQSMTAAKAHSKGCDTIEFNPGDGPEYVVYDSRRVHSIYPVWTSDHQAAMTLSNELANLGIGNAEQNAREIEKTVAK